MVHCLRRMYTCVRNTKYLSSFYQNDCLKFIFPPFVAYVAILRVIDILQ